ncbi:MAG: hypothetical protein DCE90_16955 [Pseudanabaena sp.]|nr:MAG: hypothetical protein DCE90_16955 [Pseudanabaena sp.]
MKNRNLSKWIKKINFSTSHTYHIRDDQNKEQSLKKLKQRKRFAAALSWKNLHVLLAKRLEK